MENKKVKRYASIDFMRGSAIWMMIVLHIPMAVYDMSWVYTSMEEAPIILILMLVVIIYLGSWCGFFLMISSIGNMISMQKSLKKGKSVKELVTKQVLGGFLLLISAWIIESTTGYTGYIGHLLEGYNNVNIMFARGFQLETIHAIAWAIIINGIVQGILSINGGFNKPKRNMIIYGILVLIIIVLTPIMWNLADKIIPGYPYAFYDWSGCNSIGYPEYPCYLYRVQYPVIGHSTFVDYILRLILSPIAGHPEPMFPFLAVSFIGSIVGIWLTSEKPSKKFLKNGIIISVILEIAGLIGLIIMFVNGSQDFDSFIDGTWNIHALNAWFPYFVLFTANQLLSILIMIRLVEFRGISKTFAEKTKHFRRFGFVALTVYNYQYISLIPRYILSLFPNIDGVTPNSLNGTLTIVVLLSTFVLWEVILRLWEKIDYVGSFEWFISEASNKIMPKSKNQKELGSEQREIKKWWQTPRLNAKKQFYDVEWIDLKLNDLNDSKLALNISLLGLIVFPFLFVGLKLAKTSRKNEGKNNYNTSAKIISIVGILLFIIVFITLSLLKGFAL